MKCADFNYYRAYIERTLAPNYSTCGKCNRPWKFVKSHSTKYSPRNSCFPLCETCWQELDTPAARMPYYRKLWLEWKAWGDDIELKNDTEWKDIERAVLKEIM